MRKLALVLALALSACSGDLAPPDPINQDCYLHYSEGPHDPWSRTGDARPPIAMGFAPIKQSPDCLLQVPLSISEGGTVEIEQ